jgi:hypothetical protein
MHVGFGAFASKLSSIPSWLGDPLRYDGVGWPAKRGDVKPRGFLVMLAIGLTIWGYVDIGPRGRNEPGKTEMHQTDFTVFTEAGAAFFDGRDPYEVHNPRGWHYLYPPLFAILVSPLAAFDTQSQVLVWYFLNCVMASACFLEARRIWKRLSIELEPRFARRLAWCGLLVAILPTLDCMQAGQLGIAILLLLLVGFRLVVFGGSRSSRFAGGLVLAFPAAVKLVPALPVAFLAYQSWARIVDRHDRKANFGKAATLTAGLLTGAFLYLIAIPAAFIGWDANLRYLEGWNSRIVTNERVGPSENFNIHSFRNQSLTNGVYLWTKGIVPEPEPGEESKVQPESPDRAPNKGVRVVIAGLIGLLVITGFVIGRRGDPLDQAVSYSLACCGMLLVSPLAWGHYYMAEAPGVVLVPLWIARRGWPRAALVLATAPLILTLAYYMSMDRVGALGLLGLGLTAWFVLVCVLLLVLECMNRSSFRARGSGSIAVPLQTPRHIRRQQQKPGAGRGRHECDPVAQSIEG